MTQASSVEGATYEQQQKLVSNTMRNLSIRPPVGQTPLFQEQAIVPMSVTSISDFFDAASQEYANAKQSGFRSIDWSVPFKIPTQRILFHLWSRRFAISYVQFYSRNRPDSRIGDYDFGSASSRLRMVRSFFAQQTAAWDVLIGNDSGKWLDRILIGAQSRQGEELAQQFEDFLMRVAEQEARGGSGSSEPSPSLASTSGVTREELTQQIELANSLTGQLQEVQQTLTQVMFARIKHSVNNMDLGFYMGPNQRLEDLTAGQQSYDDLTDYANSLAVQLQGAEMKLTQVMFARIKHSVNNMDLSFYMGPNQELEKLTAEKEVLQGQVDAMEDRLQATGDEKDAEIASLSETVRETKAAFDNVKRELDDLITASQTSQTTFQSTTEALQAQVDELTRTSAALRKEAENLKKQAAFAIRFSVSDSNVPLVFGRNDELDLVESLREKIKDLERRLEAVGKVKQEATQREIQQLQAQIKTLQDSETALLATIEEKNRIIKEEEANWQELKDEFEELKGSLETDYVAISVYDDLNERLSEMQPRLSSLEQFLGNTAQIDPPLPADQAGLDSVISKTAAEILDTQDQLKAIKTAIDEAAQGRAELMGFTDYAGAVRTLAEKEKQVCKETEAANRQIKELEEANKRISARLETTERSLQAQRNAANEASRTAESLRDQLQKETAEKNKNAAAITALNTLKSQLGLGSKAPKDVVEAIREGMIPIHANKTRFGFAPDANKYKEISEKIVNEALGKADAESRLQELTTGRNLQLEQVQARNATLESEKAAVQSELDQERAKSEGLNQQLWALYRERIQRSLGMNDDILGTILDEYGQPAISFLSFVSSGST